MEATGAKTRLLSFQPFSLYRNGGGSRVLRRLYMTHESEIHSIVVEDTPGKIRSGEIPETFIYATPVRKPWMRWKINDVAIWLREHFFKTRTEKKIREAAAAIPFEIVHIVSHGPFSNALCKNGFLENKDVWISFHDHYSTCSTYRDAKTLWHTADRRFVISEELGKEYQQAFGALKYELITDGVSKHEVSEPKIHTNDPITVYFAGLLHWDYIPLFKVLADALDQLSRIETGSQYRLILRGTEPLTFLNNRNITVEYRTDFVSDEQVKAELDDADILYLPIKFSQRDFFLYSLSTKMISYLGARGAILYHGPEESAACKLLQKTQSGATCTSTDPDEMSKEISSLSNRIHEFSTNAKSVVSEKFDLKKIQDKIWNP
ncbi:MAG: hypothetical protein ACO1NU_07910 [Arcticibacter sp.]